jgi:hypothetical protein
MQNKNFIVNNTIHTIGEIKRVRYTLNVLLNGLMTCEVRVINPFNNDLPIDCTALIDTGADCSVLCKSIFEKFKIDASKIEAGVLSTLIGEDESIIKYPTRLKIPKSNWAEYPVYFGIGDLSKREEYKVIIGMDVLRNFDLVYKGIHRTAWLEC